MCKFIQLAKTGKNMKCRMFYLSPITHLPDVGGVDFLELGTMSPKLDDEFPPDLLE